MIIIQRFLLIVSIFTCGDLQSIELSIDNDSSSLVMTKVGFPEAELDEKINSGLPTHIFVYIDFIHKDQDVISYTYPITVTKPVWPNTESLPYILKTPLNVAELEVTLPILRSYINNIQIPIDKKAIANAKFIKVQVAINPFNISKILANNRFNQSNQLETKNIISKTQEVIRKQKSIPTDKVSNISIRDKSWIKIKVNKANKPLASSNNKKTDIASIHSFAKHDVSVRPNLPFIKYFIDDEIQADWKSQKVNFELQLLYKQKTTE
jgi:hypothetical protein